VTDMRFLVHISILVLLFASMTQAQTSRLAASYLKRGNERSAKREYRRAIDDYTTAIAFDPRLALAYVIGE